MKQAKKRAKGGRTDMKASGNPDVFKEAEGEEDYSRKKGGRARKDGGRLVQFYAGGAVKPRLDRPGRKRGGRVGADTSPLTSAHNTHSSESQPKENGGN